MTYELYEACNKLKIAMSNPCAIERREQRENQLNDLWEQLKKSSTQKNERRIRASSNNTRS